MNLTFWKEATFNTYQNDCSSLVPTGKLKATILMLCTKILMSDKSRTNLTCKLNLTLWKFDICGIDSLYIKV